MRKSMALLLSAPLFTAACAAGPAYRAPQPPAAAAGPFVTRASGLDPTASVPDDWWRLYRDPALNDLVVQALATNADLRIASANLAKAQAVLQQARAGRLPATNLSGGASYGDAIESAAGSQVVTTSEGTSQWSEDAALSLSWEVDLFGRVRRAIQASRADAEAAEAARDAVRVTVAAETTRAYLDACAYAYALESARASFKASTDSLQLITAQEQAGSVGKLDVERAASAAATARAAIPALAGQRQAALLEVAALLGQTPSQVPATAKACSVPPEPIAALPVGDGGSLLRRRPDLRQAERRLAADTARIGVATAELYPSVSLGASGSFFQDKYVRGSQSWSYSVGPMVSWSFPNIALARARLKQARAQGDVSLAAFDGQVVTALKEVEQAMTSVAAEQARLEALREAQARSEQAYRYADLRYRAGSVAYLDVLVAQQDMLTARAAYATSLQRISSDRVDLFKALGGGWRDANSTVEIPTSDVVQPARRANPPPGGQPSFASRSRALFRFSDARKALPAPAR